MTEHIFKETDLYISRLLAPEDEVLKNTTKAIYDAGIADASISPNQGKMLQVLAKACNAVKILELGTLGGYSTIWLARALPENGKLISVEADDVHAALAKNNIAGAQLEHIVEIRTGKALDVLPQIERENIAPSTLYL